MDFAAGMVFTQQVFHLECLLLFQIKSQHGVAYKNIDFENAFNVIFQPSKNKEINFPYEFIIVFILYLYWDDVVEKLLPKAGGSERI